MITFGFEGGVSRLRGRRDLFERACYNRPDPVAPAGVGGGGGGNGGSQGIFKVKQQHLNVIQKALTDASKVATAERFIDGMIQRGVDLTEVTPEALLRVLRDIIAVKASRPDLANLVDLAENAITMLQLEEIPSPPASPPPPPSTATSGAGATQAAPVPPPPSPPPQSAGEARPAALRDICMMYMGYDPKTGQQGDMNDLRPRALSLLHTGSLTPQELEFTRQELEAVCANDAYPPSARAGALTLIIDRVGKDSDTLAGMSRIAFLETRLQVEPHRGVRDMITKYLLEEYKIEVGVLSARLTTAQARATTAEEEAGKLRGQVTEAAGKISAADREREAAAAKAQADLQAAQARIAELEAQVAELSQRPTAEALQEAQAAAAEEKEPPLAALKITFEEFKALLAGIEEEQKTAGEEKTALQEELNGLTREPDGLIAGIRETLTAVRSEISATEPRLKEIEERTTALNTAITEKETEIAALPESRTRALKLKALEREKTKLKEEADALTAELDRILDTNRQKIARISELEGDQRDAERIAGELKKDIEAKDQRIAELEAQKTALRQEAKAFADGNVAAERDRATAYAAEVGSFLTTVLAFANPGSAEKKV